MTMSDPIADMLTRIRNANTAKHDTVDVPASKIKVAIADILVKEGFVSGYKMIDVGNFQDIQITLKYGKDKNVKLEKKYLEMMVRYARAESDRLSAEGRLTVLNSQKK